MHARPTLRQLSFLIALHEHQSFSRAADACYVTQSTMSAGLKELETILAATLIERTKRTLRFTALGEKIVSQAHKILRLSDMMVETCQRASKAFSAPIKFGIIPTIAPYLLPNMMSTLKSKIPEAQLYIREDQSKNIVEKLLSADLDLILLALPYPMDHVITHTVGAENFVAAVPKGHPFASLKSIAPERFAQESILMLEEGHCLRDHTLSVCQHIDTNRTKEFQGTSLNTLVHMVDSGLGITMIPEMALGAGILNGTDITAVPLESDMVGREIALAWREGSAREDEFNQLAEVISSVI